MKSKKDYCKEFKEARYRKEEGQYILFNQLDKLKQIVRADKQVDQMLIDELIKQFTLVKEAQMEITLVTEFINVLEKIEKEDENIISVGEL